MGMNRCISLDHATFEEEVALECSARSTAEMPNPVGTLGEIGTRFCVNP